MTDLLTPPPEHDLPPARAADIRGAVLRSAAPGRQRRAGQAVRVLVPALAVLALIGGVLGLRTATTPSVLGSPSPVPTASSSGGVLAGAVETDAGVLGEDEAVAVVEKQLASHVRTPQPVLASVVLGRRVTTALGDGTFVVWVDTSGTTWWAEEVPGVMSSGGPTSGPAARTVRVPDAAHPVVRLTELEMFGWHEDEDRPSATARDLAAGNIYLVAPSVDRVEVRMTVEGVPGPWFSAPAHDGYAYVPAVDPGPHSTTEHVDEVTKIEDRAFDRDGSTVPVVQR